MRNDVVMLGGIGLVDVERPAPQLSVPAGTFCYCCLDKLICLEDGNRGTLHLAWARFAYCLVGLLDRLMLCGVAHGSSATREAYPSSRCGLVHLWLTVLVVTLAIVLVFVTAAMSASTGRFLHA